MVIVQHTPWHQARRMESRGQPVSLLCAAVDPMARLADRPSTSRLHCPMTSLKRTLAGCQREPRFVEVGAAHNAARVADGE